MNERAVLAAFDEQVRRRPELDDPGARVERDGDVIRLLSDWWTGVVWSRPDAASADRVIAKQIDRFAQAATPWEWKHYSHDTPADMPARLLAAGFTPELDEAVLVAEIAGLLLDVPPPAGVELRAVVDEHDVDALLCVYEEVFGEDHSALRDILLAGLGRSPSTVAAVLAVAGDVPIAGGRLEFHAGSEFASFWGDGTLAAWRGRGVFRAIVARRAALAAARGHRYLWVEATADSAPILRRLGFVQLGTTTPYLHPGGAG